MRTLLASALLIAALSGCSSTSDFLRPYRIDVRQGNFVSQEMVAQLKPGMSRDQVRFVLGAPLLMDVFHSDRWDYVYRFQPGKGQVQERRLTVIFEDGKLLRLDGDVRSEEVGAQ
ncbi:MAG: outer membrane protein assembly factor BamE [Zoogloea sp.]|uniref:outer membrane protein assembly factor BamE n=1 Tax=Zoogloea sp. TaxID=49181 RepID=UPI002614BDA3|nr:outer membrane protein assembly factor BamE [Zoogloea sp.]MDD2990225.1 outer membrane protein assembly factor BamE [Zoogloea sp.]